MPSDIDIAPPKRHHIARRAAAVIDAGAAAYDLNDLISTRELSDWTGLSSQFFEIGRCKGYGPRYLKLSPRRCRYRIADVVSWLEECAHQGTHEYDAGKSGRKAGSKVVDGKVIAPAGLAGA